MARYKIWDKKEPIYTQKGNLYTAEEWIDRYKWANAPGAVPIISTDVRNGRTMLELGSMKISCEQRGAVFEEGLSSEELLVAIEAFEDEQAEKAKEEAQQPTPEERIAAALEYQNLLSL